MDAIGSVLLAFCAVPEYIKALRTDRCLITWGMLLMWGAGEWLLAVYTLSHKEWWLFLNYLINSVIIIHMIIIKTRSEL